MFAQDNLFPSLGLLDDWQQTNLRAAEKTGKEKRHYVMTKELMVGIYFFTILSSLMLEL